MQRSPDKRPATATKPTMQVKPTPPLTLAQARQLRLQIRALHPTALRLVARTLTHNHHHIPSTASALNISPTQLRLYLQLPALARLLPPRPRRVDLPKPPRPTGSTSRKPKP